MTALDVQIRLQALRALLEREHSNTQDELRDEMERLGFAVNQSTVSRDLRRVGAVRMADPDGRTIYRLAAEPPVLAAVPNLGDLVRVIKRNETLAVILTDPGSASLIARHIDGLRSPLVLGSIAGDDAVFVAPSSIELIEEMVRFIEASFG